MGKKGAGLRMEGPRTVHVLLAELFRARQRQQHKRQNVHRSVQEAILTLAMSATRAGDGRTFGGNGGWGHVSVITSMSKLQLRITPIAPARRSSDSSKRVNGRRRWRRQSGDERGQGCHVPSASRAARADSSWVMLWKTLERWWNEPYGEHGYGVRHLGVEVLPLAVHIHQERELGTCVLHEPLRPELVVGEVCKKHAWGVGCVLG
jgi:hypothetical protein